jgi:alkylation response protein AidB-like acyl-CoA dehydrogenase
VTATSFADLEAQQFREELRAWFEDAVPEGWRTDRQSMTVDEKQQVQRNWDRTLAANDLAGLSWPAEYGGRGLGPIEELIYYQESARAHAPEGFGRIGRILAGPTIVARGSDEQKARYLPGILDGSEIWCQGFSEPGAGSDLASVSTRATRTDGGYLVNGQKIWTSFAQYAHRCIMLVKTDPEAPRHRNLTFLLLDMTQPGVDIRPIVQISGAQEFSEVFFTDVFVPDEDRVGDEGEGWNVAMTVLTNERGTTEAATRLVEATAQADLLDRCCATGPFTSAKDDLLLRIGLLNWQVLRATEEKATGADWFLAGSTLKVQWSELLQGCSELGVRTGCREHRDYWRFQYLESRAASIYSGSNEIQRNIITDRVLRVPR